MEIELIGMAVGWYTALRKPIGVWSDPIVWRCTAGMPLHPRRESGSLLHEPYNAKKMAATEIDIVLVVERENESQQNIY